jgi:hypothetical protein
MIADADYDEEDEYDDFEETLEERLFAAINSIITLLYRGFAGDYIPINQVKVILLVWIFFLNFHDSNVIKYHLEEILREHIPALPEKNLLLNDLSEFILSVSKYSVESICRKITIALTDSNGNFLNPQVAIQALLDNGGEFPDLDIGAFISKYEEKQSSTPTHLDLNAPAFVLLIKITILMMARDQISRIRRLNPMKIFLSEFNIGDETEIPMHCQISAMMDENNPGDPHYLLPLFHSIKMKKAGNILLFVDTVKKNAKLFVGPKTKMATLLNGMFSNGIMGTKIKLKSILQFLEY